MKNRRRSCGRERDGANGSAPVFKSASPEWLGAPTAPGFVFHRRPEISFIW
jgi:hypothetical protein